MESIVKIVYQNGDLMAKESSIFGVSFDTIFTVLTTIAIFILGVVVERWIEANKEKMRLKDLEEYFTKLIELCEKSVTKQADAFKEFADKLIEKKDQHLHLTDVSAFSMEPLKEIDKKDLFAIFIKTKKGEIGAKTELFRKLLGNIEHIDNVKKSYKDEFRTFIVKFDKYQFDYNENLKITSEAYDNMRTFNESRGIKPADDPFLAKLDEIRVVWVGLEKDGIDFRSRYVTREKYIEPIRTLCRESIGDPRAVYILKHIVDCTYAFDNIEELKKFYSDHFTIDSNSLRKSLKEIKECLVEFGKM
jgi:hypothetical protein